MNVTLTICWCETPVSHTVWLCVCFSRKLLWDIFTLLKLVPEKSELFFRGEISCREYIWHLFCSPFCLGDKWENSFTFFSCLVFITSVDIYLPWTEISADTCDTLHPANHIDWCPPERNASTVHTCSLLSNMGYFFLSPCPHLLMNYVLVEKP